MQRTIKIAVIGDFNFTYNTHHAINFAIDHTIHFLGIDCDYYWLKPEEFTSKKMTQLNQYDAFWVSSGPYKDESFIDKAITKLMQLKLPVLVTGDAYSNFFRALSTSFHLNPNEDKIISDNLIQGSVFDRIEVTPLSDQLKKLYENHSTTELSSSRYSLYPNYIDYLEDSTLDIEAINQFGDPEIVSLQNKNYFVACGFCPQISSMRDHPHPLVYTFVKAAML